MDQRARPAMTETDTGRVAGIGLVVASTAFFALAGIFTKSIAAGAWTVACWRGLVGGIIVAAYVGWRGRADLARSYKLGPGGWLLAIVGALSSLAFIAAFKLTYVANVTIIYATVPFLAAGLEWLILGEKARRQTVLTALASLAGVAVMVLGGVGAGTLTGNALALLMTAGSALYMVLIRMYRDASTVWAGGVAAFLLFLTGCVVIDPLAVDWRDALLLVCFGASYAAAVILWTEGTRLVTAAESGLLGSAEVPLAILFAWILLAEMPPLASFAGGAIVLAAVFTHAWLDFRRRG